MRSHDVASEEELASDGGAAIRAEAIRPGDKLRLDGPDELVMWLEVISVERKPKTTWLKLHYGLSGMRLRPRHDDMFAVRRQV